MDQRAQLRPTKEQYDTFGEYVGEAHSWYKHLPLMEGRQFVVFVSPDAGSGRLVLVERGAGFELVSAPDGPDYTEEHPRLHYGWKTTKEYRERFGFLDYMCRDAPGEPYSRDAGPPIALPAEVEERCSFTLYPYVSRTFSEAVTWGIHSQALDEIRSGAAHPAGEEVLELARLAEDAELRWSSLPESEWGLALSDQPGGETRTSPAPSVELLEYRDLVRRRTAIAKALQAKEVAKIRRALAELDLWLLRDAGGAASGPG